MKKISLLYNFILVLIWIFSIGAVVYIALVLKVNWGYIAFILTAIIIFLSWFTQILYLKKYIILDLVLPEQYKNRNNFYLIRWISKEFELFVGDDIVDLKEDSYKLYNRYSEMHSPLSDYSFIVFPLAKAYEGILKKILVKTGVLTEAELLQNPNITINRFYNPLEKGAIYQTLKDKTRDKVIPHVIFSVYQECRNQILHYDQYRDNRIDNIEGAYFFMQRIEDAIVKAFNTFKYPIIRIGQLVNKEGIVYLVGDSVLLGVPDMETFQSWNYSFTDVHPANESEILLSVGGNIPKKDSAYNNPLEQISKKGITNPIIQL